MSTRAARLATQREWRGCPLPRAEGHRDGATCLLRQHRFRLVVVALARRNRTRAETEVYNVDLVGAGAHRPPQLQLVSAGLTRSHPSHASAPTPIVLDCRGRLVPPHRPPPHTAHDTAILSSVVCPMILSLRTSESRTHKHDVTPISHSQSPHAQPTPRASATQAVCACRSGQRTHAMPRAASNAATPLPTSPQSHLTRTK